MAMSETQAIERLLDTAQKQLDLLSDAMARLGGAPPELYRQVHTVMTQSTVAVAHALVQNASVAPSLRSQCEAFSARAAAFQASSIRVQDHLIELAADWACGACKADVPKGATLSGVKGGPAAIRVELVCRACGKMTLLGTQGRKSLHKLFGHLFTNPQWNAEANGFLWDHR
jgi:hypothetical protein